MQHAVPTFNNVTEYFSKRGPVSTGRIFSLNEAKHSMPQPRLTMKQHPGG